MELKFKAVDADTKALNPLGGMGAPSCAFWGNRGESYNIGRAVGLGLPLAGGDSSLSARAGAKG